MADGIEALQEERGKDMKWLLDLDGQILLWIQEYIRVPFFTAFFTNYTHLGDHGIIWIVLGLLLLVPKKTRKAGVLVLASLLGSLLVNNICLKNLVARTRPYEVLDELKLLIEAQWDYSFPSGHTGSSFAAAMAMYLTLPKKYGILALVGATLMGLSRLYVGVHYPTDVLAGMLTGILIAVAVNFLLEKLYRKWAERRSMN